MTHIAWENGTIILPATAVAPVKEALRLTQNQIANSVYEEAKRFWVEDAKRTRSSPRYRQLLTEYEERSRSQRRMASPIRDNLMYVLWSLGEAPRQATWADLEKCDVGKATNRDTRFWAGGDTMISFVDRKVTWDVAEGNHTVDVAYEHPMAQAFFRALKRVVWTRGSGGVILGNDEGNEEIGKFGEGYGGSYVVRGYGPLGAPEPVRRVGRTL